MEPNMNLEDLKPGMVLEGTVTNVTTFGAFVNIGLRQDGLVHISQIANSFVRDPNDFVKVNDRVKVTVLSVDHERKRISLSMRDPNEPRGTNGGGSGGGGGERRPPRRNDR